MATANASTSAIRPGELYSLQDFQKKVGFGRMALRTARSQGLKTFKQGGRSFVFADDALAFFRSQADAAQSA